MVSRKVRWLGIGVVVCFLLPMSAIADEPPEPRMPHEPIMIASDGDFTAANGVVAGTGTKSDPYRIANHMIDASGAVDAIVIQGTTAWFVIENCHIFGAEKAGVRFTEAANAAIRGCEFEGTTLGISLHHTSSAQISENRLSDCAYGAVFEYANANHLFDNVLLDCHIAVSLYISSTNNRIYDNVAEASRTVLITASCGGNWIYRNDFLEGSAESDAYNRWSSLQDEGNYWSRYRGSDADDDGVGDTPFPIRGEAYERDPYPAMAPYHPEWHEE